MLRNQYGVREAILRAGIDSCCVSEITIAELFYGAAKSGRGKHVQEVNRLARMFQVLPIFGSLQRYGQLKSRLEQAGTRIDDFDLLIGASALQNGLILVTHNTKHFARLEDLNIEDWEQT